MNVRVIPAIPKFTVVADEIVRKKKVAAYARVSTDSEEQQTSYTAQIDYYTKHIKSNSEWEFVKVFTDEGISATNTKKRDGFNEMITRALNSEIDLIITKSVSRFARNTVDTLTTVRKLKEKGVEVGYVTLDVGIGTFRPVKCENILDHQMDTEAFEISEETAELINRAKAQGKKIVAVGTTTVRTL